MPITVMISLVVTVALFLISLLFRIAARLNLTLPLLYFLAVSTILNPWAATHEKLAFAILYLLTAFSVLSWIFATQMAGTSILQSYERRYVLPDFSCQTKRDSIRFCSFRFSGKYEI